MRRCLPRNACSTAACAHLDRDGRADGGSPSYPAGHADGSALADTAGGDRYAIPPPIGDPDADSASHGHGYRRAYEYGASR